MTLSEQISFAPDGSARIYALYRNEPAIDVRQQSPIHYGAMLLDVVGQPPRELVGQYWTDRETLGSIRLWGRQEETYDSYSSALQNIETAHPQTEDAS